MKLLFLPLLVLIVHSALCQTIKGRVTDVDTDEAVPTVNIVLQQTNYQTVTDAHGYFLIRNVEPGEYSLSLSKNNYQTFVQVLSFTSNDTLQVSINLQRSPIKLNHEVVVTAFRYPVEQFELPDAITVIDNQRLFETSPGSTPDALFGAAGIFMQKTNHGGGSPFIRGLTGQQTLLMVDGIRLNNATFRSGPNQYLNTFDPYGIERIEVVRGSGSIQYGTDALGGVLNVISKTPSFSNSGPRLSGSVYTKFLSHNMEKTGAITLGVSTPRAAVSGEIIRRDFGDIKAGGSLGVLKPTGYDQLAGNIKSVFRIGDANLLTLSYQNLMQDDVPVFHKVQLENFKYNNFSLQKRQLGYARWESFFDYKMVQNIQLTASLQKTDEGRESQKNGSNDISHERDEVLSVGFTALTHAAPSERWQINSGIEFYHDEVSSGRFITNESTGEQVYKRSLYPDGSTTKSAAVFTQHSYTLNKFVLSSGIRYNHFSVKIIDGGEGLNSFTLAPTALVGNVGLMYKVNKHNHITATVNNAFRAPNVDDLGTLGIVDFRYEVPNNNLEPEQSLNFELGYKIKKNNFSASVSAYRNNLYNIIDRVRSGSDSIQGYQVYFKENIAEAFIQGLEMQSEWKISKYFLFRQHVTYTYGKNITKGEPYRRIPPVHGLAGLRFNHKNLLMNADFIFAGKQERLAAGDKDDNRIAKGGTPGWTVLNINTGYTLQKNYTIGAGVLNLFNKAYRTHGSGVDGYGRSFWISLQAQF